MNEPRVIEPKLIAGQRITTTSKEMSDDVKHALEAGVGMQAGRAVARRLAETGKPVSVVLYPIEYTTQKGSRFGEYHHKASVSATIDYPQPKRQTR